ncbi:TnpV protein [Bengtsoniella intestinalis]|uniref:TnpV protein n=1 Tax=Bengtsoniella intestinalis TaxID=3073143 RepID=UPI00391F6588
MMKDKYYNEVNGLHYTLAEDGMYYPDLELPPQDPRPLGKYGLMRKRYLQEHRKVQFTILLTSGKLSAELHRVDDEARNMVNEIVAQMAAKEGTDSALKMRDQMRWVGLMNNYKACAEEIVLRDIVYA